MNNKSDFTIDVEKVLHDKAGRHARYVPQFVISWLKRLIHQDEMNEFFVQSAELQGLPWLEAAVKYLDMRINVKGLENLPSDAGGRCFTFVSNHPLGGIDGIALGAILGRHYEGRIRYLVNDLLMNLRGLAPLCVPINKTGAQTRQFPALVEACFSSPNHVIMFPAGICSRRIGGQVTDLPWRKTFVRKSVETRRDVVPIHFGGENSRRFYRIATWSKRLGIPFNLAMLFLPDEMYRNRHQTFEVRIGKPIPWQTFSKERTDAAWAAYVRNLVYQL